MALSTRKFPSAMTSEGYASSRSSFLIPSLDGELGFVDIRTGKRYDSAYLVYIGRSITSSDVLEKLLVRPGDMDQVRLAVDSMIEELARFKVGNVVAVDAIESGKTRLRLVANAPKSKPGPKLPG
jgi:hypothetical protein